MKNISRHRSGWLVRIPHRGALYNKRFADSKHGGEIPAREAAAAWRHDALQKIRAGKTDGLNCSYYQTNGKPGRRDPGRTALEKGIVEPSTAQQVESALEQIAALSMGEGNLQNIHTIAVATLGTLRKDAE